MSKLADAVSNMLAVIADVNEVLRDTENNPEVTLNEAEELADMLDEAAARLEESWKS